MAEDLLLELVSFVGRCLDSLRERAQDEDDRELVGCACARAAEAAAASEQLARRAAAAAPGGTFSGAVTITLRSWTSATRRTSTALRRASNSTRRASWRSPARGIVIALARERRARRSDRVERVVLSLQAAARHGAVGRPRCTALTPIAQEARRARHRSGLRPRPPRHERRRRVTTSEPRAPPR